MLPTPRGDPFFNFFSNCNRNTAEFLIVGAFAAKWAIAVSGGI
jgi:hypothetical protein